MRTASKKPPKTRKLTLRFTPGQYKLLEMEAEKRERTPTNLAQLIIIRNLNNQRKVQHPSGVPYESKKPKQ